MITEYKEKLGDVLKYALIVITYNGEPANKPNTSLEDGDDFLYVVNPGYDMWHRLQYTHEILLFDDFANYIEFVIKYNRYHLPGCLQSYGICSICYNIIDMMTYIFEESPYWKYTMINLISDIIKDSDDEGNFKYGFWWPTKEDYQHKRIAYIRKMIDYLNNL